MYKIIAIILLPPILLTLFGFFKPGAVFGVDPISVQTVWGVVGTFASYGGLILSFYAVIEVRSLSSRYFAKTRLPELQRQLQKITNTMSSQAETKLNDLRNARHFGESGVVLKQIKKMNIKDFNTSIAKAETCKARFENLLERTHSSTATADRETEYWNLFRSLSAVADEIEAYNKGVQASI